MSSSEAPIVILGAGITGLTTGLYLQKSGIPVTILEKNSFPGGMVQSEPYNNAYLEKGPNTVLLYPEVMRLLEDLGLEKEIRHTNESSRKRYILRNNRLHGFRAHPLSLLKSSLLSLRGRWRLIRELWVKSKSDASESVEAFFLRRLGKEAFDYLVEPGLTGIYAGDPQRMHMASLFPDLIKYEEQYGSVVRGFAKQQAANRKAGKPPARSFGLEGGFRRLIQKMAEDLQESLVFGAEILQVKQAGAGYSIQYQRENSQSPTISEIQTPTLISTLPAHKGMVFSQLDGELSAALLQIPYVAMGLLHLVYPTHEIQQKRDGFGFLVPSKESAHLLGAIWNSAMFPAMLDQEEELFTLMFGGARKQLSGQEHVETAAELARHLFEQVMGIQANPVHSSTTFWAQAIPQFEQQHPRILQLIQASEKNYPGLYITGNFRSGVSVGKCIAAGQELASRIISSYRIPISLKQQ